MRNKKEYIEAEQAERIFRRENHIKNLPKNEQEDHEQINSICQILTGRKIPFFFFPYLRSWGNPEEFGYWQFNNIVNLFGFDKKENISEETRKYHDLFTRMALAYILSVEGPVKNPDEGKRKLCEIYDKMIDM